MPVEITRESRSIQGDEDLKRESRKSKRNGE